MKQLIRLVCVVNLLFILVLPGGWLMAQGIEKAYGGIIRGATDKREIALIFTGGSFAEGADTILTELKKHNAKASFFFTGDFFRDPEFENIIKRIIAEGHYIGPHSDKHLLLAAWEDRKTLVDKKTFVTDLENNIKELERFGVKRKAIKYWIPPYEHYNDTISQWSEELGITLFNFTPGTRSNADYTGENDKNFVSSEIIFQSILKKEREDKQGLNGFLLLLHIGAGPGRTDKFHYRFPVLMNMLSQTGYKFVRVDELLNRSLKKRKSSI